MSGPACCPNDRDNAALEHPHRLELGIDALATRLLVEPIPVAIDPVGDRAYTPGRTTSTPANRPLGG